MFENFFLIQVAKQHFSPIIIFQYFLSREIYWFRQIFFKLNNFIIYSIIFIWYLRMFQYEIWGWLYCRIFTTSGYCQSYVMLARCRMSTGYPLHPYIFIYCNRIITLFIIFFKHILILYIMFTSHNISDIYLS